MSPKYVAILAVVVALVGTGAFIYKTPEVVEEEVTPTENVPIIPPTHVPVIPAPNNVAENPEGEADPDRMRLDMTPWRWIQVQYNDGTKIIPKRPERFILTFKNDGTFSASTDCNGIGGKYKVGADRTIVFSEMMSTLMMCTESQETEFRKILENANVYSFTSRGELLIDLKFDSGTATFR